MISIEPAPYNTPHATSSDLADFYANHQKEVNSEAERLQGASARLANPVSKLALEPSLVSGAHVLDVGAGADTSLGFELQQEYGCTYTAIDPNEKFVTILREAGIEAHRGDVTEVPVESNSADAVHMRFVWGWLNEEQRKAALLESIRALKVADDGTPKAITVIDYDWSSIKGPDEFVEAATMACDILDSFGFDVEYGRRLPCDIEKLINQVSPNEMIEYAVNQPQVYEINEVLGKNGLVLLEETAESLKEGLMMIGDIVRINAINTTLERLRELDPNAQLSLPSIVAQTISVFKKQPSQERSMNKLTLMELKDYDGDSIPTSSPDVVIAVPFSKLDNDMRVVQAYEYLKAGLVGREAIDQNGMLAEDNYPMNLLERSMLLVAMPSDTKKPTAAVRLIATSGGGSSDEQLGSLPTAKRLNLSLSDKNIFPSEADPSGVVEISAFIRNSQVGGEIIDMARVILEASSIASASGYHTGLMTIQERAYKLIKNVFGENNFKTIRGPHEINIPGTLSEVKYVSLAVDICSFLDGVKEYVADTLDTMERDGKRKSSVLSDLHDFLAEYYPYHKVA